MSTQHHRRQILALSGVAASTVFLPSYSQAKESGTEVGAVEDLMREHGIIRRAILVYRHSASKLGAGEAIDLKILERAARLLRSFGEDYHERKLEEAHIFPAIEKAGGRAAEYIGTLLEQHRRGREITKYVLAVTGKDRLSTDDAKSLVKALDGFELMYEHHAAREDTIVFPAWKQMVNKNQLAEMGELFEQIERQQFGKDGFEDAEKQISDIEAKAGIANIAQFTPAAPPV